MATSLYLTPAAAALLLAAFLPTAVHAQDDCPLTFNVEQGCLPDGTGWAAVRNVQGTIYTVYHYWDNSLTPGPDSIGGLTNGTHNVRVTDLSGCELIQTFTLSCAPADTGDCAFRTQTQGGWGSPPNGNNPGAYLAANFAAAFPNGLEIGCTNKLRLTNAAEVRAFLPSGTTARTLPAGTLVDPGNSYKNVLAGQLVALTLSLGFDAHDPAFGASTGSLANATLLSGTFQGFTVQQLVDEANNFIGGCASSYTAAQLNSGLTLVNENFVDGSTDNGNVGCSGSSSGGGTTPPAGGRPTRPARPRLQLKVMTVPVEGQVDVVLRSDTEGPVQLEVRDLLGRSVGSPRVVELNADTEQRLTLDMGQQPPAAFILVGTQGSTRSTERFVTAR